MSRPGTNSKQSMDSKQNGLLQNIRNRLGFATI